jgi:CRISPR-associated protein Csd1
LCGRLFAVFDRLQYFALGGVNAGVVERYYASASVTPALVMGRLFRNAQFHLAKAEGGIAENVRKDFETITCALGDKFKPTLTLEEQGRFALGLLPPEGRLPPTNRRTQRGGSQSPERVINLNCQQ